MRAIIATTSGPAFAEVSTPDPRPGELLIHIHAAALNRIDLRMTRGMLHGAAGGLGQVCGMEWAGEVADVGHGVTGWSPGDRVMGVAPHAFAEFTTVDARVVFAVPDELTLEEAATLPVGLQTMHDALVSQGTFTSGESVLVQGASSGMGIMGMQIAKELGASLVIGTSTNPARRPRLWEFGADIALNSRDETWVADVLTATDGDGIDLLLDLVAGPLVDPGMRATRIGGRMVNVGRVGGEKAEIDVDLHSLRRITYVGTSFRTRGPELVSGVVAAATRDLNEAIAAKRITMPIAGVYPLSAAIPVFAQMERNEHFGKLVLTIDKQTKGAQAHG